MKTLAPKKDQKQQREQEVLFGLIENYIQTGKPVGSNTLKEDGFDHLSSATIRNYFAKLEEEGYLDKQHTSGGRIPTEKAFKLYALNFLEKGILEEETLKRIENLKKLETKEVHSLIRFSLEELGHLTQTASFVTLPRFDRDFVVDIKVIPIDFKRTLIILVTDFGSIQSEVIQTDRKLSSFSAKRIEAFLQTKLGHEKQEKTERLDPDEERLALRFYHEAMVRFLVGTSANSEEDVMRTGFSHLLQYNEFRDPIALAAGLSLFENNLSLRHLARDTMAHEGLRVWIGSDLKSFGSKSDQTTVLTIPYTIHHQPVGVLGVLGPLNLPYRKLFGILKGISQSLSESLTKNLYKFKISYRQPEPLNSLFPESRLPRIEQKQVKMIEFRKK